MNGSRIKIIIKKIAEEYELDENEVREMVSYQFKFLKKVISSASKKLFNYKTFRLRNIGAFYVPQGKIAQQKRLFNGKEEDFDTGGSG